MKPKRYNIIAALLILFALPAFSVEAQHYDLQVGTERYFSDCGSIEGVCLPAVGANRRAAERVIGEVEKDGTLWKQVVWEITSNYDYPAENLSRDTTLLRADNGKLLQYRNNQKEKVLFDYNFEAGDSLLAHVEPYLPDSTAEDLITYIGNHYRVAPANRITIDTVTTFPDGKEYRVMFGHAGGEEHDVSPETFVDSVLTDDHFFPDLLMPLNSDFSVIYHYPFYFVDGLGVIATPVNHRSIPMSGIKTADGDTLGNTFRRSLLAPDPVRLVAPERGKEDLNPYDEGHIEFTWQETAQAETYHFQLARDSSFEDLVTETNEISDTTYTVDSSKFSPRTTYSWRVRGENEEYSGNWTIFAPEPGGRSFTTGTAVSTKEETELPDAFSLFRNYPNPFNPVTHISYQLPASGEVTLEIFDLLGRRITTLVSQQQEAGQHEVSFDASGLSSGTYLYRLKVTDPDGSGGVDFVKTRQMMLVK